MTVRSGVRIIIIAVHVIVSAIAERSLLPPGSDAAGVVFVRLLLCRVRDALIHSFNPGSSRSGVNRLDIHFLLGFVQRNAAYPELH